MRWNSTSFEDVRDRYPRALTVHSALLWNPEYCLHGKRKKSGNEACFSLFLKQTQGMFWLIRKYHRIQICFSIKSGLGSK